MPITYEAKDASKAWPAGDYDATLVKVEDAISKTSGNEMQKWTIKVYNSQGKETTIFNYVTGAFPLSIKFLAKALGKEDDFKANRFQADDYVGSNFRVTLSVEDNGEYGEQNKIKAWLPKATGSSSKSNGSNKSTLDDAKRDAWDRFKRKHPNMAKADLESKFTEIIKATFAGKAPSTLNAPQWLQLIKNDFEVPTSPISDEPEFKQDDIPF